MSRRQPQTLAVLLSLWLALLGAAIALSMLAAIHTPLPGDTRILTWAQDQAVPGLTISKIARAVTTTQVVLAGGGVAAIVLWLARRRTEALVLVIGLVALSLLQTGIKELVDRARPWPPVAELRAGYSSPSFPSGHVMSPTVGYGYILYLALCQFLSQPLKAGITLVVTFALVMTGPANVWVGVHWPSDVLGGYAWGLALLLPMISATEMLSYQPALKGVRAFLGQIAER